ncbi:MAG: divalent metal cation transporter [Chitinophagaceae bacterium]|nr:divalent metal cation transporter [Chitinophagaceae bacterium]MCE2758262.1 divalent metal cation transporter [Chitinophagaceae bacterium]
MNNKKYSSPLIAAAFLMATSAIGPGFLTQTAVFTNKLFASFGFVILISILLDIGAQLNIWRILCASGKRAQVVANEVLPGAGYVLTILVALGGLAFNCGNLAGAGLGLNVLTGLDVKIGASISAVITIIVFINKESLKWMDVFAKILGTVMILLMVYVVIASDPPISNALHESFLPKKVDFMAIITLVGGTVGGYISFAGAHRLIDAGKTGNENIGAVSKSAVSAILLASTMRAMLFLAALGVVSKGISLNAGNPAADVFQQAAGLLGYKIFGIIMWSAAITSVVGSAYTSVSFLKSIHPLIVKKEAMVLTLFVLVSLAVFIAIGQPVKILVTVGALNGLILPIALLLIIAASYNKNIVGEYRHPLWLKIFGWMVMVATLLLSIKSFL